MIVQQYYAECNNCRFRSGYYYSIETLIRICEKVGWIMDVMGERIICPHCVNQARNPEDRKSVSNEDAVA